MIKRTAGFIVIGIILAIILRLFVIEGIYVASGSMEPTLTVGQQLFLEKLTLRFRAPRPGEIIVCTSPVDKRKDLIKRVIGLPGDEIAIYKKIIFLNGLPLNEEYVQHTRASERLKGDTLEPVRVPPNMVFVAGDNRDESGDSRDWIDPATGEKIYFIPFSDIKGRVISLY
ncbi:MAG: signal peptidase I [bacterium]